MKRQAVRDVARAILGRCPPRFAHRLTLWIGPILFGVGMSKSGVLVLRHPDGDLGHHLLIPKTFVRSPVLLSPREMTWALTEAVSACRTLRISNADVVLNAGRYQQVPFVHLHLLQLPSDRGLGESKGGWFSLQEGCWPRPDPHCCHVGFSWRFIAKVRGGVLQDAVIVSSQRLCEAS